jgi:hypothetical protein
MSGILSDPNEMNGQKRSSGPTWPTQPATKGLVVRHRTTGIVGSVVRFSPQLVRLKDQSGRNHDLPVAEGAFSVNGSTVSLTRPPATSTEPATALTASGSIAPADHKARVAVPSRLLVEGLHDAELVEKIWGDDLRVEGVVVEPLHGADDLVAAIAEFEPTPDRRLGVLLDHLVDRSKERRLADAAAQANVLIRGHHFVDIWQAIQPDVLGFERWPEIPRSVEWKEGIRQWVGFDGTTGELWRAMLSRVGSYRDLDPSLVGAVEELIDFVAPPPVDFDA